MEKLFTEFEKKTKTEWIEIANRDLKGDNVLEKYSIEIESGLSIDPLYHVESQKRTISGFHNRLLQVSDPTGESRVWCNTQKIIVEEQNLSETNKRILNALESGADGILLDLSQLSQLTFDVLLKDVKLRYCRMSFIMPDNYEKFATAYLNYLKDQGYQPNEVSGGIIIHGQKQTKDYLFLSDLYSKYPEIRTLSIKPESSGSATEEIAQFLTQSAALLDNDNSNYELAQRFELILSVDCDYFISIAKIRAARQLFFQMVQAFGFKDFLPEQLHITCISEPWITEQYEPHGNMLKSSTAAMASILGGCNSLIVQSEDSSNPVWNRIARNVSSILKDEAYLSKAVDPVAGSYFLEELTDKIAQSAWEKFKKMLDN